MRRISGDIEHSSISQRLSRGVERTSPFQRFGFSLFLVLLLAAFSYAQEENDSADRTATFLAGLAVPAAPVDLPTAPENPWLTHATAMDRAWKRTNKSLAAIASWAPNAVGPAYSADGIMFYFFSGPDFLYAHAFFPEARTYILCGNEPVGAIPDLDNIPPPELSSALANVRHSLESVLDWSFFITKNMKTDLSQSRLNGTLPLLYVFLARTHCTIQSVTPVSINRDGKLAEDTNPSRNSTPGVRIVFTSDVSVLNSQPSTLYYFCSDLSDDGIKSSPGFLRFCEQQGRGVSLLKAASYLMHEPGFSEARQFLLAHSDVILQDDSGIPFRYFEPRQWTFRYYGSYLGPIKVFEKYWQNDVAEATEQTTSSSLPFGFGYQWQPNRSGIMILNRRSTAAPHAN
jgi:hypothetical protein